MSDINEPTTPGGEVTAFTEGETKIICAVMQNLTSEIQFDVDAVSVALGYKNASSFRARWNTLKRAKITAGGINKSASAKKAKSTPKKVKADIGSDDEETPVKGKKAGGKGKAKGKVKVKVEEDEAVESVEGADGVAVGSGEAAAEDEK